MRVVFDTLTVQVAIQRRVEQRARVLDGYPVGRTRGAARPPGVQQYATRLVLFHLLAQQIRIHRRHARHEWTPVARAESGLRLFHTHLRSRQLCGKALHEVVHDLLALEHRERRKHAKRIRCQKHDGLGVITARTIGDIRIACQRI